MIFVHEDPEFMWSNDSASLHETKAWLEFAA